MACFNNPKGENYHPDLAKRIGMKFREREEIRRERVGLPPSDSKPPPRPPSSQSSQGGANREESAPRSTRPFYRRNDDPKPKPEPPKAAAYTEEAENDDGFLEMAAHLESLRHFAAAQEDPTETNQEDSEEDQSMSFGLFD